MKPGLKFIPSISFCSRSNPWSEFELCSVLVLPPIAGLETLNILGWGGREKRFSSCFGTWEFCDLEQEAMALGGRVETAGAEVVEGLVRDTSSWERAALWTWGGTSARRRRRGRLSGLALISLIDVEGRG
jgi:hypothetical protein